MPTATIGSPQTIALGAADALIISCSAVDAVASVAGSTGFVGAPYELGRVVGETGRKFGPYGRSVSVIVSALAGSITAEVSQPSRVGDGADAMSTQQGSAAQGVVSGAGIRSRRVRSMLGAEAFDLMAVSGLPAGASFSGAGTYASANILAVQSTGTVTHNPTGWYDGTACLEFTPNTDANAEFRIYLGGQPGGGVNISDDDGIGFEFGLPADLDTSKSNFSVHFDFSSDAANLFPANTQYMRMWVCDQTVAQTKEKGGRKYVRNLWDATAATDAACGAWPGLTNTGVGGGTGADRTALCKWVRFRISKFSGKTLKFKSVRRGGRSTPCFVLGSDQAGPETLFSAMSYLASKGMPGYLAQYVEGLTTVPAALAGYKRAHAAGIEITGDDVVDRPLGSTLLDEASMRAAVEGTRDGLKSLGFTRGGKVWVANNNSSSALMVSELARAGYVANRNGATDGRYVFPEGGVNDPFRLPALSIDQMNWTAIQPVVDRAIAYGCTSWLYWHGVVSSARIDADRTANITGTAGAPIARSGVESLAAYRARAVGLGAGAGAATVVYLDARLGSAALGIWWEELKQLFDYLAPKNQDGTCVVAGPEEWCADVGLLNPAA